MKILKLKITEYTDYRFFLRDFYHAEKKRRSTFSYGVWARELGLKSSSTLIMLVKGQRNPGRDLTEALSAYFSFSKSDAAYFRDLVLLEKSQNDDALSVLVMERLAKKYKGKKFKTLDSDAFAAISNWYFCALRQASKHKDFCRNPKDLSQGFRFTVKPKQVEDAISSLSRMGLMCDLENENALSADIDTNNDISDEGLKRFHEQMLENARLSLRTLSPVEREVRGITFAMSKKRLPQAKELIRKFHQDLCELVESDDGDTVYQLESALIPLFKHEER